MGVFVRAISQVFDLDETLPKPAHDLLQLDTVHHEEKSPAASA